MKVIAQARLWLPVLAVVLSAGLLIAAYPPLEWDEVAWIAWVPLLLVGLRRPPGECLRLGYASGLLFWLGTLYWLTEVTWFGWLLLSMYCALFVAGFAGLTAWLFQVGPMGSLFYRVLCLFAVPLLWVGFEFIRSVWFTGFAWNPLGGSQFNKLPLIQLAAWTGVYGVSALVVLINTALALTVDRYVRDGLHGRRSWHPEMMLGFLALAVVYTAGGRSLQQGLSDSDDVALRTALIQPNIPQYQKWTSNFVEHIYEQLNSLSTMAIRAGAPDLVIWPETAVPDYVRDSRASYGLVRELTQLGAPLLVGSMDIEWVDEGRPRYYNSSLLFDENARLIEAYDKQHLVLFGEYVPLGNRFPFLQTMSPIEASFDAGRESTVFELRGHEVRFSVLICFEDTVARLARRAVGKGARLLINQTNDAWFRETAAARQHMTHSVLRAVENRVPVVRAANTGISCGIDRYGRVHDLLADETGNTFVAGFKMVQVDVPGADWAPTFYTQYGNVFAWFAQGMTLVLGMVALASARRKPTRRTANTPDGGMG